MTVKGQKLTPSQAAVYDVLKQFGPIADHALVPLAQHQMQVHQSLSGFRSRRAELTKMGIVHRVTTSKTGSGRTAGVYGVV